MSKIVVLGGAGLMGRIAVKDLAASDAVREVVIADRDVELAHAVVALIPRGRSKVSVVGAEVTDHDGLVDILQGADAVLNAVHYYFNMHVMHACLEAGVHYTDLGGLFHVTRQQLSLHDRYSAAGLTAVLGMGSAPGIPNVQARYAADRLETVESIRIYDGILPPAGDDIRFGYAIPTIMDELLMPPMVFRAGSFLAEEPLSGEEDYWFAPPIGLRRCHLSLHSEVATLPLTYEDKGVRECFFKINYWGMSTSAFAKIKLLADLGFAGTEVVDLDGTSIEPRGLLMALLARFVPPVDAFVEQPGDPTHWTKEIVTEVRGTARGKAVTYRVGTLTPVSSLPTGVAPSIVAQWLASGRLAGPGVLPPEAIVEPLSFFAELKKRGIVTQVSVTGAVSEP